MGMSASQVRYLTLTARIHDIENQAQRVQNQKLLLANDSDEVYQRYLDALDRTKIQLRQFDDDSGTSQMVDVTLEMLYKESCSTFTNGYMLTGTNGDLYLPFNVSTNDLKNYDNFEVRFASYLGITQAKLQENKQLTEYVKAMWRYINEQAGTDMFAIDSGTYDFATSDDTTVQMNSHGYNPSDPDGENAAQLRHKVIQCSVPAEYLQDTNWIRDIIGYGYANFQMMSDKTSEIEVNAADHKITMSGDATTSGTHKLQMAVFNSSTVSTDTQMGEVSDEVELAKAEVEYESDMKKINAKDKRYDTELSSLENQRTAIKEEMDGLKKVAEENIQRTFKLFS